MVIESLSSMNLYVIDLIKDQNSPYYKYTKT